MVANEILIIWTDFAERTIILFGQNIIQFVFPNL